MCDMKALAEHPNGVRTCELVCLLQFGSQTSGISNSTLLHWLSEVPLGGRGLWEGRGDSCLPSASKANGDALSGCGSALGSDGPVCVSVCCPCFPGPCLPAAHHPHWWLALIDPCSTTFHWLCAVCFINSNCHRNFSMTS